MATWKRVLTTADDSAYKNSQIGTGNGGLVPAQGTSGDFLKHDGTFGTPSYTVNTDTTYSVEDGGLSEINFTSADHTKLNGIAASANNYSHPTTAGNKHIPSGGASGQFLKYSASGTAVWAADNNTTYSVGDGGLTQKNFTTTRATAVDNLSTNYASINGSSSTNFNANDLILAGNLTVSGTTTTVETETISLADNVIILNSNSAMNPVENAGLEVERGDSTNTQFYWNESDDRWEMKTLRDVNEFSGAVDESSMTDVVASMRLSAVAPTSTDTSSGSYAAAMGAFWMETDTGDLYVCTDPNVNYNDNPA